MTLTKEIKKYAKILFGIYMFCLFWIVILKCNLRQGVLECRYTWSKVPLNARMQAKKAFKPNSPMRKPIEYYFTEEGIQMGTKK